MGNQGYSHDATRVACEIFWSGEIGEVNEVHAWTGRPSWPQGMTEDPAADARPDDARLGPVAGRRGGAAVHRGDDEYMKFVAERNARGGRGGGGTGADRSASTCRSTGAAFTISAAA